MPSQDGLQYGLDRLIATGKRIFGWGWVAHDSLNVLAVRLRVQGVDWERHLQTDRGLARPDVAAAFPRLKNAASCGFIATGYIPDAKARRYSLEVELEDGSTSEVDVTDRIARPERRGRKGRQLTYVLRAVWRRLRRGDLAGIVSRARGQSYAASTLDDELLHELMPRLRVYPQAWLVFDHNMGGGANQYRRALVDKRLAAGDAVLVCTYNLPMLEYRLHLHLPGKPERIFRITSFLVLEPLFETLATLQVFVNSPVSFEDPLALAEWLARVRVQHAGTRLVVTTHDYFAACPSFVLLDSEGTHCGVPDATRCTTCLPAHRASYVALSPPTDVVTWRASWGRCLSAADEVRCFSQASRRLLLRAYPSLDSERVTLIPHVVDFAPTRVPRLDAAGPLVIGIVGEISPQKGAHIVTRLVDIVERERLPVRIVVLGTLDAICESPSLTVTGRYERARLGELVEAHRINMFLFASVWPETFSYVVSELIALTVPIVAFDLGAPAERVREYARGRIASEITARCALDTMLAFHAELANAPVARVA